MWIPLQDQFLDFTAAKERYLYCWKKHKLLFYYIFQLTLSDQGKPYEEAAC